MDFLYLEEWLMRPYLHQNLITVLVVDLVILGLMSLIKNLWEWVMVTQADISGEISKKQKSVSVNWKKQALIKRFIVVKIFEKTFLQ